MATEDFRGQHGMGRTEILYQHMKGHTGMHGKPGLAAYPPRDWRKPMFYCDGCLNWHTSEPHRTPTQEAGLFLHYCDACFTQYCVRCRGCTKFFHLDDMSYDDERDEVFCESCLQNL